MMSPTTLRLYNYYCSPLVAVCQSCTKKSVDLSLRHSTFADIDNGEIAAAVEL
jgi:hypothetical protein